MYLGNLDLYVAKCISISVIHYSSIWSLHKHPVAYTCSDETQDYFPSFTAGGNEAGQGLNQLCEVTDEFVAEL